MPDTWKLDRGLLGFPEFTSPSFLVVPDTDGVYATLGTPGDEVAFLVARPGALFPDYVVDVPDRVVEHLGIAGPDDAEVWVICTQQRDGLSVNLRGPLVVNRVTGAAAQVVLDDSYPTAAPLAG